MAGKKRSAEDDEEAFPRGGSQALTPLEKRQLEQQAKADLAQEQQEDVSGNSKGKRVKRSHHEVGCMHGPPCHATWQVAMRARHVLVRCCRVPCMMALPATGLSCAGHIGWHVIQSTVSNCRGLYLVAAVVHSWFSWADTQLCPGVGSGHAARQSSISKAPC